MHLHLCKSVEENLNDGTAIKPHCIHVNSCFPTLCRGHDSKRNRERKADPCPTPAIITFNIELMTQLAFNVQIYTEKSQPLQNPLNAGKSHKDITIELPPNFRHNVFTPSEEPGEISSKQHF